MGLSQQLVKAYASLGKWQQRGVWVGLAATIVAGAELLDSVVLRPEEYKQAWQDRHNQKLAEEIKSLVRPDKQPCWAVPEQENDNLPTMSNSPSHEHPAAVAQQQTAVLTNPPDESSSPAKPTKGRQWWSLGLGKSRSQQPHSSDSTQAG